MPVMGYLRDGKQVGVMPKERIYGDDLVSIEHPEDGGKPNPRKVDVQLALGIGWAKDGDSVSLAIGGHCHDEPGAVGEFDIPGYCINLDWGGMNRLIEKARTARDQAFGRPA